MLWDDIKPLLEYDTFKGSLKKLLKGETYRYYWFDQMVTTENYEKQKRRILIFESDAHTIEKTYKLLTAGFDLYESSYCGLEGIMIIFRCDETKNEFEAFLDCIR